MVLPSCWREERGAQFWPKSPADSANTLFEQFARGLGRNNLYNIISGFGRHNLYTIIQETRPTFLHTILRRRWPIQSLYNFSDDSTDTRFRQFFGNSSGQIPCTILRRTRPTQFVQYFPRNKADECCRQFFGRDLPTQSVNNSPCDTGDKFFMQFSGRLGRLNLYTTPRRTLPTQSSHKL